MNQYKIAKFNNIYIVHPYSDAMLHGVFDLSELENFISLNKIKESEIIEMKYCEQEVKKIFKMNILELNNNKYSRSEFEGWLYRAKFEVILKGEEHTDNFDIYTTDSTKASISDVITKRILDKVLSIRLVHFTTKEQDDLNEIFIEETLKNI